MFFYPVTKIRENELCHVSLHCETISILSVHHVCYVMH
jgi:hypothetical protein